MNRFLGKLFIYFEIEALTGLRIGGARDSAEIGGLDNPVIKTVDGKPYIPASSLKGKIRCLLERKDGVKVARREGDPCGCGQCEVCQLFGAHPLEKETSHENKTLTRLCFRDAFLNLEKYRESLKGSKLLDDEIPLTEEKMENIIDRLKGTAQHPRPMERVPAGAVFDGEVVVNFYEGDDVKKLIRKFWEGLRLLVDDYLGGSGTRGYGKVTFRNLAFSWKTRKDYQTKNQAHWFSDIPFSNFEDADHKLDELCEKVSQALYGAGEH
ncbi:MAG: CRISPR-associated protein Csm3 [Candidatus Atribacteria bacterium]|nr:CRISPR-associated protein Csm3 [Candidatus Atribacteria bacterium]